MQFHTLPWDSDFFHIRVGKLDLDLSDSATEAVDFLRSNPCDLTYVFPPEVSTPDFLDALTEAGATLVDVKIIYRKNAPGMPKKREVAEIIQQDQITPELARLASRSGWCSRFFRDPRLRPYFEELYRRWVESCLSDPCGGVWCSIRDGRMAGMACATVSAAHIGKLGLIAVDDVFQGHGIGKMLMAAVEDFYSRHGATTFEVATQQVNAGACHLYERCGYSVAQRIPTWHYWK